ncbi:hypothetical protein GGR53DRAFT_13446 [Hypoxylon sp. FL1150]|nr:hypothetical protein GGR53DRAFT_13446 [Hypoxylon sp. FL1150]
MNNNSVTHSSTSSPSEYSLQAYAHGLPFNKVLGTTHPAFLSDPDSWRPPIGSFGDVTLHLAWGPKPKIVERVGDHPIRSLFAPPRASYWPQELFVDMAEAIKQRHAPSAFLRGITLGRIGYPNEPNMSYPVLLIEAKPRILSWDVGCLIAKEVLETARQFRSDLDDVQCEIYEILD